VAYVGKALALPSALLSALLLLSLIIFHLGFPLANQQLSSCRPAWKGKPMVKSLGCGAWGHPKENDAAS